MAKLKICGLKRVEDIDYVNELKVDYIGFILSAGYKRSIDFKTAQSLKNRLSKDIKAVGVFVDEDKKYIDYYINPFLKFLLHQIFVNILCFVHSLNMN